MAVASGLVVWVEPAVSKNDDLSIKKLKNEESCIETRNFVLKTSDFVFTMMNFVLNTRDFVFKSDEFCRPPVLGSQI